MITNDTRILRNWSSTRPGKSMPAEYNVTIPIDIIRNNKMANGASNTIICDRMDCQLKRECCMINPLSLALLDPSLHRSASTTLLPHRFSRSALYLCLMGACQANNNPMLYEQSVPLILHQSHHFLPPSPTQYAVYRLGQMQYTRHYHAAAQPYSWHCIFHLFCSQSLVPS